MKHSPRFMAIDILVKWEKSGGPVEPFLHRALERFAPDDPRDRQLLATLVNGVLRRRAEIDWVIDAVSSHPLAKMNDRMRQALRVGVLQLLFLDRVPASAAVNETVKALKAARQPPWLSGFANALLRSVERQRQELVQRIPDSAALNHPDWLVERWRSRYGQEAATDLCRANNGQPPLCLRVNTQAVAVAAFIEALRRDGIAALPGLFAPAAVRIPEPRGPVTSLPGFGQGHFQVQDEAAQLVTLLLGPFVSGAYLDACAGLGGKTTQIAAQLPPGATLTAVEPDAKRFSLLQENLARHRQAEATRLVQDSLAQADARSAAAYDRILVDAPCSGTGVIRRHPDIKWNRRPEDLAPLQAQQLDLLRTAADLLRPGGILVYATCSTEPEENEAVVETFLAGTAGFSLTDGRDQLPEAARGLVDEQGFFRSRPDRHDIDGFFAARLQKE